MFEDILGPKEKFYDDTTEWYGDSVAEETKGPKGPKVIDLSDFIDEKELEEAIDKVIQEALKGLDEHFENEEDDGPLGI